ncbi:MAG TPA: DinB family protein [Edaphobacter sp.]|nr:DinB family protein [Edaphobacter sp.]
MTQPALSAEEVIAWNEQTATGWRQLLANHPELLNQPCDIAGTKTVAELLQHIVAAQLRYAERLADLPMTDYASIPFDSVESIYAVHDRAIKILRQLITSDIDWNESIDYVTRSMGSLRSDRKTILFHALLHGIRHYAQLASLIRQCGVKPGQPMDYLFMHAEFVQP